MAVWLWFDWVNRQETGPVPEHHRSSGNTQILKSAHASYHSIYVSVKIRRRGSPGGELWN
jgi:hypothetical protein